MQRESADSIVRNFVDCINNGDLDGIAALTAPTYTFTDMEGKVYILEGRGTVLGEDGERPLRPGDVVYVAPGEKHCFLANQGQPLSLLCLVPRKAAK